MRHTCRQDQARQQADKITQEAAEKGRKRIEAETSRISAEARSRAGWEAARIIAEAKQRAVRIIAEAKDWLEAELEKPAGTLSEPRAPYKKAEEELYQGMMELEIVSLDPKQVPDFVSQLQRVPNLQVVSFKGSSTGESMVVVVANRPLPLPSILREIPSVESAVSNGGKIQVTLK